MLILSNCAFIRARISGAGAALFLAAAVSGQADTIVSSLNNASNVVNFSLGAWAGSPFKTDTRSWTLTSATVRLELGTESFSAANVRLMSDNLGKPGASLADLGTQNVTNGSAMYTFTAPVNVTLGASTTYWIVVGNVGTNGGLNVALSEQGGVFTNSGVAGSSMVNSISSGATVGATPPTNWFTATVGMALLFAVEGTPGGGGTTNAGPTLSMTNLDATRFRLTWPTNFSGYTLTFSSNLLATAWTRYTGTPTVASNVFSVTITNTGVRNFYRLSKP